jgi:hypothetical protein
MESGDTSPAARDRSAVTYVLETVALGSMPAGRCASKQFHAYARPKRFTVVFYGLNIFGRKAAQLGETPRKSARHIHL